MVLADIIHLFGRLHPLVLHLPIGIFVVIALYMLFSRRQDTVLLVQGLTVNMAFTVITVVFGLILASEGGYAADILQYHKLSGIGFLLVQGVLFFVVFRQYTRTTRNAVLGASVVLLLVTGHLGGVLTHGSSYLTEHLPRLRPAEGEAVGEVVPIKNLDSARVFSQIVYPVLEQKCVSCHNPTKRKGGLELTSYASVLTGGEHGASVIPGDPGLSDLLRRARLPERHIAAMPPEGNERLTDDELAVISWWIEKGAPDTALVGQYRADAAIMAILKRLSGSNTSAVFRLRAPELDSLLVAEANKAGWLVKPLAAGSNALLIEAKDSDARPEAIRELAPNIYELDVSDMSVGMEWTDILSQCANMSLLNLSRCTQVEHILGAVPAGPLRVLILNETDLADLHAVSAFSRLKRVYLLDTQLRPEAIDAFRTSNPAVEVIAERFTFEPAG
jgi:mono/diheme cytochrome c family protein